MDGKPTKVRTRRCFMSQWQWDLINKPREGFGGLGVWRRELAGNN